MRCRGAWVDIAAVSVAVAVVSLALNVVLPAEMEGHLQEWSFVRKTLTKVANSGTVWAVISVYAGWRLGRPLPAVVAGVVAPTGALLLHYLLMIAFGMGDETALTGNTVWFIAAVVLGAPLGWCGWLASRPGRPGLLGRLVVPLGAIAEPFVTRKFTHPFELPWPERWSDTTSGVVLLVAGLVGAVIVTRAGRARARGAALPTPRSSPRE